MKAWLTLKKVVYWHLLIIIPLAIYNQLAVTFYFDLAQTPGTLEGLRCIVLLSRGIFGYIISLIAQQFQYSVHTVLNLLLNILTIKKLWDQKYKRLKLVGNMGTMSGKTSSLEARSTLAMVVISVIHTAVYIPCAVTWPSFAYYANKKITSQLEYELYLHASKIAHTFLLLTGTVRFVHFIILCTIPSFRDTILCRENHSKHKYNHSR